MARALLATVVLLTWTTAVTASSPRYLTGSPRSSCRPAGSPAADKVCSALDASIHSAIANHTAPGMGAAVVNTRVSPSRAFLEYHTGSGGFTYDDTAARVTADTTLWDMASCSKIMATTTATAQLYQRGFLGLDTKLCDPSLLGPAFANQGKADITVRNLMLHNAGFPPDPNPGYSSPLFPCPQNSNYHPGQDFSCHDQILNNLLFNQSIVTPPGSVYVYSDLSMITMMFAIGSLVRTHAATLLPPATDPHAKRPYRMPPLCDDQPDSNLICFYYAYVKFNVFDRFGLTHTDFVPTDATVCPPQWADPWYHHALIAGYVSDQNAYAMGGVAGHAGVFTTVQDTVRFMAIWMGQIGDESLNATTRSLFTTIANITQSSRALGWDTNDQPDPPCGNMSAKTFLHIGYTGTEFCGDPETGIFTVLLANGRYPNYLVDGMIQYRPVFGSLVQQLLE